MYCFSDPKLDSDESLVTIETMQIQIGRSGRFSYTLIRSGRWRIAMHTGVIPDQRCSSKGGYLKHLQDSISAVYFSNARHN